MPHPPLEEIERLRREYDDDLEEARASGDRGRVKIAYYHATWARRIEAQLRDGTAPTEVRGPVHAVRIGDGVIVTGPGETFTEYGIAVKERSPGAPTLYAGYTNEILGYLPTANEYQYGGYEAGYGYKSVGLPSLFDPERRADPRRDGRAARRAPVPGGRAVGRGRGLACRGQGADAARGSARAPLPGGHRHRDVTGDALLVGAARLSLEPPLGLPLVGFVRQTHDATGYGRWGLETSAIAVEQDGLRIVLCGVDIVGIGEPEISVLLDRIAEATGADPAGILVNWNHTHLSVIGGAWGGECAGPPEPERDARIRRFADVVQDKVVSVCALACERLEPARPVWGVGYAELAVNRRERAPDGTTILGWNPDAPVDNQVTSLQFRRPDESVVATAVNYGCHPVTTGYDMYVYSADFPGPLRDVVRRVSGGEVVFLQGAGGNVLPKVAFTDDESEAELMGTRLGIEALHSLAGRFATPRRMVHRPERSIMQISSYRRVVAEAGPVELAATMRTVRFPLQPLPSLEDVRAVSDEWEAKLADAVASGSGNGGAARIAYWHAGWARKTERSLLDGTAPTFREGRIHAIRDRRRRDRVRPRRGVQRDRDGGQGAQPRHADDVRRASPTG